MVIKLYISGISGNKEVKKKQQRVQMILDSKQISYEAIDITEPGKEKDKEFMQQNGKVRESLGKYPLPPQIFNDDDFCGDYEDFDMANEVDELEKFLHIETSSKDSETDSKRGEDSRSFNGSTDSSHSSLTYNPYEYHTIKIKFNGVNGVKEETISNDLPKEIEEEVTKSEVNGESEAVPGLDPSSENVTENVETPDKVGKEDGATAEESTKEVEGDAEETQGNEDESQENAEESVENVEETQVQDEGKAGENVEMEVEEEEEEEKPKGEEESPKEEEEEEEVKSPPPEAEDDKEGEESEEEDPQSEKSQEE